MEATNNVFYVDLDSVHFDFDGFNKLVEAFTQIYPLPLAYPANPEPIPVYLERAADLLEQSGWCQKA